MLLVVLFYTGHLDFSLSFSYYILNIISRFYFACQMTMWVFFLNFDLWLKFLNPGEGVLE